MSNHWKKLDEYSSWRKIAMGMWSAPKDPTIYGFDTLRAEPMLEYIDAAREATDVKVTIPAYLSALMGKIFEKYPELNVMPIGSKIVKRENIDVFCQVAIPGDSAGSADLSGVKLRNADQLELPDVARLLRNRATDVREGRDEEMEETKSMVDVVPTGLMSAVLDIVDFLTYKLPIDLDGLGVRSDPFGSCMVTSVAQFDIKQGCAPLLPMSHCPLVLLPGKIWEAPFAEDGEVFAEQGITLTATFDHRVYDGLQIGCLTREIIKGVEDPTRYFPDASRWADDGVERETDVDALPEEAAAQ